MYIMLLRLFIGVIMDTDELEFIASEKILFIMLVVFISIVIFIY